MFERFSLPDIPRVARRTVVGALVLAVVALVGLSALGDPLMGLGAALGFGLGIVNFRMVTASVVKVGQQAQENKRRPLATNTLARLGVLSVIIFGLLFVSVDLGFGILGGMAVFYMLLLFNVTRAMYHGGYRRHDTGGVAASGSGSATIIDAGSSYSGPTDSFGLEPFGKEE